MCGTIDDEYEEEGMEYCLIHGFYRESEDGCPRCVDNMPPSGKKA